MKTKCSGSIFWKKVVIAVRCRIEFWVSKFDLKHFVFILPLSSDIYQIFIFFAWFAPMLDFFMNVSWEEKNFSVFSRKKFSRIFRVQILQPWFKMNFKWFGFYIGKVSGFANVLGLKVCERLRSFGMKNLSSENLVSLKD